MTSVVDNVLYTKASIDSVQTGTNDLSTDHNAIFDIANVSNSITIPEKVWMEGQFMIVKYIGIRSFSGISEIASIIIPNTVISIKRAAFWTCTGLTDITFVPGSRLESLGYKSLDNVQLVSLSLPDTVRQIDDGAIYNCHMLKYIYYCGSFPFDNEIFAGSTAPESIYVHSGYPISFFGGHAVNISNDMICSSVIYRYVFTYLCSRIPIYIHSAFLYILIQTLVK